MSTEKQDEVIASETFTKVVALLTEALGAPGAVFLAQESYSSERWFAAWGHVDADGGIPRCLTHRSDVIRLRVEDRGEECIVFGLSALDGHIVNSDDVRRKTVWLRCTAIGTLTVGYRSWCDDIKARCASWMKDTHLWNDLPVAEFIACSRNLIERATRRLAECRRAAFWSISTNRGRCATAQAICECAPRPDASE